MPDRSGAGVLLYGPPGSGKDTVTAELAATDPRYVLFRRLKASLPGAPSGDAGDSCYRVVSRTTLALLETGGQLLYRNERYGNSYAVDRSGLDTIVAGGGIPVVHLGQVTGLDAVSVHPFRWLRVLLWCPQLVSYRRVIARGSVNAAERLQAWDETRNDLLQHPEAAFDLVVRTDLVSAPAAAAQIHAHLAATACTR